MKKNYLLLLVFCISLAGCIQAQEVRWNPEKGTVYGDMIRITDPNSSEDLIENRFIGFSNGDILSEPWYDLNGFVSSEEYVNFEYDEIYISQLTYPGLYAVNDINTVTLHYTTNAGEQQDIASYYYSKPVLSGMNVNGDLFEENMIVVNPEEMVVKVRAYASMYNIDENLVEGDDYISGIHQVLDGDTTILNTTDTRDDVFDLNVDVSGLSYGLHELVFFAEGRKESTLYPDEFSEPIRIRILVFDFAVEGDDDYAVCKCDCYYFLKGIPEAEGGIFSGECVVESSNVFNPSRTQNLSTTITYSYPVDGDYYDVIRTINFDPLPEISLDVRTMAGFDHEVCGFEHGAVYEIMGTGYSGLTWDLPLGIIKQHFFEGDNKVFIDWAETGDGLISVTATSSKACETYLEHMIHISQSKAPEDSAWVTIYDKMIFCSDTNVSFYYWYKNDLLLDRTDRPYYVLENKPVAGETFYVWTASDTTGCNTHSHIFTVPQEGKYGTDLLDNDPAAVSIFPNPANESVNCKFLRPASKVALTISDVYGNETGEFEYQDIFTGETVRIPTHGYPGGVYILHFLLDDNASSSVKLILY